MKITRKIPLPIRYDEHSVLSCDACGVETDDLSNGMIVLNWRRIVTRLPDGTGGVKDEFGPDYCADCWPKLEKALEQEQKAIKAEKLEAKAESIGIA